jgi:hypothetical protein
MLSAIALKLLMLKGDAGPIGHVGAQAADSAFYEANPTLCASELANFRRYLTSLRAQHRLGLINAPACWRHSRSPQRSWRIHLDRSVLFLLLNVIRRR